MKIEMEFELQDEPKQLFDKFVEADRDGHLFKKLPNVKGFKQIELKKLSDGKIFFRNFAEGKAPIPAVVQSFIFPNMLVWEFYGERDHKKLTIDWQIKPSYFQNNIHAKGKWQFKKAKSNGSAIMHLDLEIRISIPIFGKLLEQVVAGHTKENMTLYIHMLEKEIYKDKKDGKHKKDKILPV